MKNQTGFNHQITKTCPENSGSPNHQIGFWLLSGAFLIFLMVVIGGITRLTGSGLSITEWKPIMGAIPPMNENQWQEAFQKYQQIPQFQKLNYDFTLSDFKEIFFWEYLHRLVGRLIGVVFILGFIYFLWKKKLSNEWIKKSLFLFALGGLQGFLGWFMVSSGLSERTSVSHYRLAIHLMAAFITYGFTLWYALQLLVQSSKFKVERKQFSILKSQISILLILILLQITYGAFTAGLHAGKVANTFPKMDGEWIPSGFFSMSPVSLNFFENILAVQFIHRSLAWLLIVLFTGLWFSSKNKELNIDQKRSLQFCFAAIVLQFILGVLTILYKAPIVLATLHQIGGFVLFSSLIIANFNFGLKRRTITGTN